MTVRQRQRMGCPVRPEQGSGTRSAPMVAGSWHRVKPSDLMGGFLISTLGLGLPARPTSEGCYGDKIGRHL